MINQRCSILFLTLFLLPFLSSGQFRHSAKLAAVNETGFYRIAITPDLSSYLLPNLADLRIVDEMNQPVPYITEASSDRDLPGPVYTSQSIITNLANDSTTLLVIGNDGRQELSNFAIELKSASAERTATLTGSDNNKDWFVVLDNVLVYNPADNSSPTHFQYIKFPPSSYRFFRLNIRNGTKAPLNIIKVSTLLPSSTQSVEDHILNPSARFVQEDRQGFTVIKIYPGNKYHVDNIKLVESRSSLFKRAARIYSSIDSNLRRTWSASAHHSFIFSSDNLAGESFRTLQADSFFVLIGNGDNPPLKIKNVVTAQARRSVVAQFEKGGLYRLLLNDPAAFAPKYDLEEFKSRIPSILPSLEIISIDKLPLVATQPPGKKIEKWWIWPVLILVIAILCLLAWKLTTDMRNDHK
jgi:hypothetical protein